MKPKMKTKLLIILTTFAVAAFATKARADCCDPGRPMTMHTANPDQNAALMEPVKPVFQVHRDSRTG
jgi:hypothetical protein